jgi:predicted nucleic acid-binding protein
MKKLKLYLDTTIWNFPFTEDAPQYQSATVEFFKQVRWGRFDVFVSEAVASEISFADQPRRGQMEELWRGIDPRVLERVEEVGRLAGLYLQRAALPRRSRMDAVHVAYATVYGMDILLSWNMDHLANVGRRSKLLGVNLEEGYSTGLQITTPLEVIGDE